MAFFVKHSLPAAMLFHAPEFVLQRPALEMPHCPLQAGGILVTARHLHSVLLARS